MYSPDLFKQIRLFVQKSHFLCRKDYLCKASAAKVYLAGGYIIMPRKGIQLPVNSVIIIALAIFVLLMLAAFFSKSGSELDKTQVNSAFNQGCSLLASAYSCDQNRMQDIKTNLVVNGQALNLLQVCRVSFNDQTKSALKCKFACQTCQKYVYDGSPCEDDSDCVSPLTPEGDWICARSIHQCQCGSTKCRKVIEGEPIP